MNGERETQGNSNWAAVGQELPMALFLPSEALASARAVALAYTQRRGCA